MTRTAESSGAAHTAATPEQPGRRARAKTAVQRFGGNLAAMVMPNIGAFIAWGLITALFIPDGWWPNETLAQLVGPMITFLLPVLIGYTGGRLVHGQRGAVVGAVATLGVVVGSEVPMFLGAMIVGPLGGWLIKLFDEKIGHRTKPSFKMLVDNFSAGIVGGILAVLGMLAIGPVVRTLTGWLGSGVQFMVDNGVLPLASIIIEPAKVMFLNNAINHGVLAPIGAAESAESGKAIQFLMETNPGPGLGILVACMLFGPRLMRASAPGAMVIHFFGGIHEIYFPYVLARPRLILAAIAGGAAGVLTFVIVGAGTTATPAPGSIIALMAVTPKGGHLGVLAGVAVAALVSFLVAALLLGFGRTEKARELQEQVAAGGAVAEKQKG
ncbi:MAG: mannitol-specific PTS transporter subunit IIC [Thermocrispum sp.]